MLSAEEAAEGRRKFDAERARRAGLFRGTRDLKRDHDRLVEQAERALGTALAAVIIAGDQRPELMTAVERAERDLDDLERRRRHLHLAAEALRIGTS